MTMSNPVHMEPSSTATERNWTRILAGSALFWCGLLVGVSFLATPAKFMAPSLSMPVALDVGRQTFFVFNRVEWIICAVTAVTWMLGTRGRQTGMLVAVAAAIVLVETLWLLPLLDARVGLIIAGQTLPATNHHVWYVALEATKVVDLAALGIVAANAALRVEGLSAQDP